MSAIFGLLRLDGSRPDPSALAAMDGALAAHGVDGAGVWSEGPVALGNRLTCVTAEDGLERQPLAGLGGTCRLILDGRIDNREELGRASGLDAAGLAELPDSALLMASYARWGEGFLDRVAGELAVAIWCVRTTRLLLACSAPLARPLVYVRAGETLAFASRPSGLFASPGVRRELDLVTIARYVARTGGSSGTSTFFHGVLRVLPGEMLLADRSGVRSRRWWQPELRRPVAFHDDGDYVEGLTDVLTRVVRDSLRGAGAAGMMLSGGLDSGAVAAVAAASHGPIRTYTEVPPPGFAGDLGGNRYADETPRVRALARMHPELEPRFVDGSGRGLLADLDRYYDDAEQIFRNASNRGWYEAILDRARGDGVRVLLTGDQGNLAATWNGDGVIAELLARGRVPAAIREARALARAGGSRSAARALLTHGVLPWLPVQANRRLASLTGLDRGSAQTGKVFVNPAFVAVHAAALRPDPVRRHPTAMLRHRAVARRLEVLQGTGVLAAEIGAGYRARFGIDVRAPLADRRLVEFCLAVPDEQQSRGGEERLLMRRAMAHRLPASTLAGNQRGLQAAAWFETLSADRDELIGETDRLAGNALASELLNVPQMRATLERWPASRPTTPSERELLRAQLPLALVCGRYLLWAQRS